MVLALTAEQRMAASPATVFDLFGAGSGAGWVFDAACDRLVAGAAVTLRAPLGGPADRPTSASRLCAVIRAGALITAHEEDDDVRLLLR